MNTNDNSSSLLRFHIEKFCKLTDADWELLLPHLEIKAIRKNELFIAEGKQGREVAFVIEGMFRQYYTKDGEEKTTYFFFENHLMSAYLSCITGKPSLVSIEALSNASYISFSYKAMQELFEQNMAWQKFGRLLAEYLAIGLEERMVSLLLQSPEERYVDLLNSNKKKIIERIPQHFIANYLGITPVSMSRIRNRLLKNK
ncbi:Crp/Fnr family transcriptional regulator [Ferruginibacter sp. SUN106]|uniref:Crp/Fnr family transcriptional regulator n=1 Tax=Ferruginibacter sp. SUN106 TaxID=2978348 RepID=UPI003D369095